MGITSRKVKNLDDIRTLAIELRWTSRAVSDLFEHAKVPLGQRARTGVEIAPFVIGPAERDAWLDHMRAALGTLGLPKDQHDVLWDYLERAAYFMVNRLE